MEVCIQKIKPALMSSAIALGLYLSGFLVFWTALPLFYLSLKKSREEWKLSAAILIGLGVFFYFGIMPSFTDRENVEGVRFFGLAYLTYYVLVAWILSRGVWEKWSLVRLGGTCGLVVTGAILLVGFVSQILGIYDVLGLLQQSVVEATKVVEEVAKNPGVNQNRVEAMSVAIQMKEWLRVFPKLIPSLIFIFTVGVTALNFGGLRMVTRKNKPLPWMIPFNELQLPTPCLWILITSGLFYFLDAYFLYEGWLTVIAMNLLIAIGFLYFLQGLSIVAFFTKRYSALFRFGIYGLVLLLFQTLSLLLAGLGLADTWFHFRKIGVSKEGGPWKSS